MFWVGVNTSQHAVTMEMQPEQGSMVPLILNAGEPQSLQLPSTSPPLSLSQVQYDYDLQNTAFDCLSFLLSIRASVDRAGRRCSRKWNSCKTADPVPYLLLFPPPQAAISAMNLEQQLSQYAFFNQQPSNQNQQVSRVPQPAKDLYWVQGEHK